MKPAGGKLTLVVPGLLGPLAPTARPADVTPPAPALERVLTRARRFRAPAPAFEPLMFSLFETPVPADAPLPVGPVTYAGDAGRTPSGWWLRADPVHLRPDQQRLLLVGGSVLGVSADEATALVADLNEAGLVPDGRFEAPVPARWYLQLPDAPGVRTHPLTEVLARPIDAYLPYGEHAGEWHRRLNELQMWLHDHPVNQARAERGAPTINSLWPWGAGTLPTPGRSAWQRVAADDPLTRGLTHLAGSAPEGLPEGLDGIADEVAGGESVLCVVDTAHEPVLYGDVNAWAQAVAALEKAWLAPAIEAVQRGRLGLVELYPAAGDGTGYWLGRTDLWRVWRRQRSLAGTLARAREATA